MNTPLPTASAPISSATGTAAPLSAGVPMKVFGIMFLVILVAFLVWYMLNRRRYE